MNEEKFTGKADNYDKYRLSYPAALIDWLYEKTAAETVADIGAGTGKFTACLTAKPWKIIAVEPNADMLEKLRVNVPQAAIIQAPAEKTEIAANSVELVTTAQAFHWFDGARFRAECGRILRPDGYAAIVYNNRDESAEIIKENYRVNKAFIPDFHGFSGGRQDKIISDLNSFFNSDFEEKRFENPIWFDEDGFIRRNLSSSYAPSESKPIFAEYVAELKKLFGKYSRDGRLMYPNTTVCYFGKVK